jgi:hypothetical protein
MVVPVVSSVTVVVAPFEVQPVISMTEATPTNILHCHVGAINVPYVWVALNTGSLKGLMFDQRVTLRVAAPRPQPVDRRLIESTGKVCSVHQPPATNKR